MTGDLAAWLRAQLDADEQTARAADEDGRWAVSVGEYETEVLVGLRPNLPVPPDPLTGMWGQVCCWHHDEMAQCGLRPSDILPTAEHIARHDPAFTLADITAKRAIIDLHQPAWVVGFAGKGPPFCDLCGRRYACGPVPASLTPEESETMDYPCTTLRLLARPYAGRPGWHNEWNIT